MHVRFAARLAVHLPLLSPAARHILLQQRPSSGCHYPRSSRCASTHAAATLDRAFFTPLHPLPFSFSQRPFLFTRNMASTTLDEDLTIYLQAHAPNNAGAETDAVKASHALFPEINYTDAEKTELGQWLHTASHLASPTEDAAKSADRLASLNTHLASRTNLLGAKPSVADIAIYHKLAPVVTQWSAEQRTGEHGYHHIVRHVDFVQNSPVFGLKLDAKISIDQDSIVFNIKPVDAKAEKERKKKEKEAAVAALSAEQGSQGGKGKKDKAQDKVQTAGEVVASAVAGKLTSGGPPEGVPTKKKEKKEKQPKPPKAQVFYAPQATNHD